MLRILHAVNVMDRAGLETMLMNYYRNINRDEIQFDFLTHRLDVGAYEEEITSMGGRVYHAPRLYPQNYKQYFEYTKQLFYEHEEYQIVHAHIDTMSAFPLMAAKKSRLPVRIAHSHSSKLDCDVKLPIKYVAKLIVPKVANEYFACGEKAGRFLYGEKTPFNVIHNAVDLEKFSYDEKIRRRKREELEIPLNTCVIGHVGRYCYIKNQVFLLDVFERICERIPNSMLLLIGKGEDEQKLKEIVRKKSLGNRVRFLIDRSDISELYQTMDAFVMPSLFEGLPVVGVEAQANGLPCFFSDTISDEIYLSSSSYKLSLKSGFDEWANKILSSIVRKNQDVNQIHLDCLCADRNPGAKEQLTAAGYDIKKEAKKLEKIYFKLFEMIKRK